MKTHGCRHACDLDPFSLFLVGINQINKLIVKAELNEPGICGE